MCIYVINKCLSQGSDKQQDLGKQSQKKQPSQAIDGKLISILSYIEGKKTQSALGREQEWTPLLGAANA
jgi:hypothetical protein